MRVRISPTFDDCNKTIQIRLRVSGASKYSLELQSPTGPNEVGKMLVARVEACEGKRQHQIVLESAEVGRDGCNHVVC